MLEMDNFIFGVGIITGVAKDLPLAFFIYIC
jgi:hypothetical protein